MERSWEVHRTTVPLVNAQQRWDLAYQFLLQWLAHPEAAVPSASCHHQEEHHGDGDLCPGFDAATTTGTDD
jgi:hypothetical protein